MNIRNIYFCFCALLLCSCDEESPEAAIEAGPVTVSRIAVDGKALRSDRGGVSVQPEITIGFNAPVKRETLAESITLSSVRGAVRLNHTLTNGDSSVRITVVSPLDFLTRYTLRISTALTSHFGNVPGRDTNVRIVTTFDPGQKLPRITDKELLTEVQRRTFAYFWNFAHPVSGMARERNTSGDIVTVGGTGFGLMAIIIGIERGFIQRTQGVSRVDTILSFLEKADRFHGAWPHWLNGSTGRVVPFSTNDNGGDLVETSFLVQGLLAVRQYLDETRSAEKRLIDRINGLWRTVEWNWYRRGGQDVLYWHWSPDKEWAMNHRIEGHNETLIAYVLAASSPTHAIPADVYHKGYARNGAIRNGKSFYGIYLPLGEDLGGPLFFAHYSFLGLDPRNLSDQYANYQVQNTSHSRIHHAYSLENPKGWAGYSGENWGLTASDTPGGYTAHAPANDRGVITPSAALSSIPYTPDESLDALRFFYYTLGDRLWGRYGFYDAFSLSEAWFADSYLAIDQGPIIVMIENYRTGLLWRLFMSGPEVRKGLDNLGFRY